MRPSAFGTGRSLLVLTMTVALAPAFTQASASETMEGTLEVLQWDEFANGRSERIYRLTESSTGERYELTLNLLPTGMRSGSLVTVRGTIRGKRIEVDSIESAEDDAATQRAAAESGSRAAVVLVLDFTDAAVSCDTVSVTETMFTGVSSVDGLYRESSFGQLSFPGDTDGDGQPDVWRLSIDGSTTDGCATDAWTTAADAAAQDAGVELSLYRHRIYVLPSGAGCSWAGMANLGCGGLCRTWIRTCHLPDVYAHELGHNLGMHHSTTDPDNDGTIDCEYCDTSDFMGLGGQGWRQVNGPHKDQLDWLPPEKVVLVDQTGTQTHVLSPLGTDPSIASYPQTLKIYRQSHDDFYYLSYRTTQGYDSGLSSNYANKTNIHTYQGSGPQKTLFVAALDDGQQFDAPQDALTVTQVTHDATSATLLVTLNDSCSLGSPTIDLTPSSQTGRPADLLVYGLAVTNHDGPGCGPVTFDLAASPPPAWTAALSSSSLTLAPGDEGTVELSVTSPSDAAAGSYIIAVAVSEASEAAAHSSSVDAIYVVEVDAGGPERVTDLRASVKRNNEVTLRWSAPTGAEAYNIFRDEQSVGVTTQTRYVDRSGSAGEMHRYYVVALDGAGNASAPSSVVEVSLTGRSGGGRKGR